MKRMINKISLYWKIIIKMTMITITANLMACSKTFCNAYSDNVYGIIADIGGRITNVIPIAIGELLMYVGIIIVLTMIIIVIMLNFFRKRKAYRMFAAKYIKAVLCIFVFFLFVYTFNWVIPFRSSIMGSDKYNDLHNDRINDSDKNELKNDLLIREEHLRIIRTYIVNNLNQLVEEVGRDTGGHIIYSEKNEVEEKVAAAMRSLSGEFSRLDGFYPQLKFALCSELLNYMWIGGYTYPYTMEITGNRYSYEDKLYYPALYAHESAHHHGYYQENEANLLEYLGCINSDDKIIRYAGYLAMYYYIDDAYISVLTGLDDEYLWEEYEKVKVSERVWADSNESVQNSSEEFENADKPMQQFENTAEDVADAGWDVQGELLDENSYDGVVDLMLIYYEGKLY